MTNQAAEQLRKDWQTNPRWAGIKRPYSAEDVVRLRGSAPTPTSDARQSVGERPTSVVETSQSRAAAVAS